MFEAFKQHDFRPFRPGAQQSQLKKKLGERGRGRERGFESHKRCRFVENTYELGTHKTCLSVLQKPHGYTIKHVTHAVCTYIDMYAEFSIVSTYGTCHVYEFVSKYPQYNTAIP